MNVWDKKRIERLENSAAVLKAIDDTVTVEISLPLAWLIRDWIGFGDLQSLLPDVPQNKPSFMPDMHRLNDVLGHRPKGSAPTVQKWSHDMVTTMKENK